jgi:large repetitive protein
VNTGTSATQDVTVTNTGNSTLSGTHALAFAVAATPPFARVTTGTFPNAPNCGASLDPGAACTVRLSFTPGAAQGYSGTLTVTGPTASSTVNLIGTGVAPPTVAAQ